MEYAVGNDAFSYVEAGDLKVDRRLRHKGYFSLPLSHYHGISMCFDLSMIPMELARLAGDLSFGSGCHPAEILPGCPATGHSRSTLGGSHFSGVVYRTGADQNALLSGKDSGVVAVSRRPGIGKRNGKTIFLPFPRWKR